MIEEPSIDETAALGPGETAWVLQVAEATAPSTMQPIIRRARVLLIEQAARIAELEAAQAH